MWVPINNPFYRPNITCCVVDGDTTPAVVKRGFDQRSFIRKRFNDCG